MEEDGGICLYTLAGNDVVNGWDFLGAAGNGHHVFSQSVSRGMSKAVIDFFDNDLNRIFNDYYKSHGAERMGGISAKRYNTILREELQKFLGRNEIKNLTLDEAKAFMTHLGQLPSTHEITIYNKAVETAAYDAMKRALAKQAERAAASSLVKAEASGARKIGGRSIGKMIPVVGTVVAVYFIYDDAKVYGAGPATINGLINAIPVVGTGKVGSEIVAGGRWLDVTVGPKEVQPTSVGCGE